MKRFLGFVAMVLALAACNTMEMDNQPTGKDGMITITAQLAPKTAMTKALAFGKDAGDNDIIVSTWEVGEHLAIRYYLNGWNAADAEITAVDENGTATISFSVKDNTPDNTDCFIIYPYAAKDYFKSDGTTNTDFLKNQTGSLNSALDLRLGEGKIHTTSPATLEVTTQPAAKVDIFKFSIQDIAGTDKTATAFKVRDGSGNLIASVTPGSATGTLYVVLPVLEAGTYWFNATIDNKRYIAKATTSGTVASKYYQSTVKMATIGNVIAANGKFYKDANAADADNTTAVAMITVLYPSNDEKLNGYHGRALALSDAGSGNKFQWRKTAPEDYDHTKRYKESSGFDKEEGLDYNATHNNDTYPAFQAAISNNGTATPPDCSAWYLPSGEQWNTMISSFESYSTLRDAFEAAGGTNMNSWSYWSCSETDDKLRAWKYSFNSSGHGWGYDKKVEEQYVRSALAF